MWLIGKAKGGGGQMVFVNDPWVFLNLSLLPSRSDHQASLQTKFINMSQRDSFTFCKSEEKKVENFDRHIKAQSDVQPSE